ncbi:hypothetical protein AB0N14_06045 [Streptomyces sp. NPDC051104]|uniref:hypothetical protein n=1 Tax=Streptomyces sp. NPDC051104 TaxID=3155044 RepID=UPI00341476BE
MLQLAAEHRVDLDQPVQHYLPDVLPADPRSHPAELHQQPARTDGRRHAVHARRPRPAPLR